MPKKAPRRTAQRILEAALELFNRFGEPSVSTTLLSAELRMSSGNLYYHFPARDAVVNALFDRHEAALRPLLQTAPGVRDADGAWRLLHGLSQEIWDYRFLYRNLGDLVARNRYLETRVQELLGELARAVQDAITALVRSGALQIAPGQTQALATSVVVLQTSWLSHAYARDPRRALEPDASISAVQAGAGHALGLLAPYFGATQQARLRQLLAPPAAAAQGGGVATAPAVPNTATSIGV